MGIEVPEAYGGAGMDPPACASPSSSWPASMPATSTIVSVNNSLYCNALLACGSEEQKREFLVPVACGAQLGAYSHERAFLRQRRRYECAARPPQRCRHALAH